MNEVNNHKKISMKNRKKNIRWESKDLEKLKQFIQTNSEDLISNMLVNIVVGYKRFRKPRNFFVKMGTYLTRESQLCKSKFQKLEHLIYTDFMKVPEEHYNLFRHIRKLKPAEVNYNFDRFGESQNTSNLGENSLSAGSKGKNQNTSKGINWIIIY